MAKMTPSVADAAARLNVAVDEQLTEVRLFQEKLGELAKEIGSLRTGYVRYDDSLETVMVAATALGDETRKTAMLMGRV